jgi:hypothetical protein
MLAKKSKSVPLEEVFGWSACGVFKTFFSAEDVKGSDDAIVLITDETAAKKMTQLRTFGHHD